MERRDIYRIAPTALESIVTGIVDNKHYLEKYDINTPRRVAHFLAQTAHESGGFTTLEESFNYSATALPKVFSYFRRNPDEALRFGRTDKQSANRAAIANRAYGNRMGNGPPESGDGWRYRGRGLIQTTGRNNYVKLESATGATVIDFPDLVIEFPMALIASCVYWNRANCNMYADKNDIAGLTYVINGGSNGLDDRIIYTSRARKVLE